MSGAATEIAALARKIEAVPAAAVSETARWFVPRSERVGGYMRVRGRVVQLTTRVRSKRVVDGDANTVLAGFPAGCWSIKSYGRRGGYEIRPRLKQAMKLSNAANVFYSHVTIHAATKGDGRWDRLVDDADAELYRTASAMVDRSIR